MYLVVSEMIKIYLEDMLIAQKTTAHKLKIGVWHVYWIIFI